MLPNEKKVILSAHIRANTDAEVIAALDIRNDVLLANLYNQSTNTDAWITNLSGRYLFQISDVSKFDALSTGKRDAWRMMLDFAPIDFSRQKDRKAVVDVWGTTDSVTLLQACTRKATLAEFVLGGDLATTNTVTALKLNWEGQLSHSDISSALNNNL